MCKGRAKSHGGMQYQDQSGYQDAFATARALANGIEKIGDVDLVLCGIASSDGATEWVGPQIATFWGVPVVTMVKEIVFRGEESWEV